MLGCKVIFPTAFSSKTEIFFTLFQKLIWTLVAAYAVSESSCRNLTVASVRV